MSRFSPRRYRVLPLWFVIAELIREQVAVSRVAQSGELIYENGAKWSLQPLLPLSMGIRYVKSHRRDHNNYTYAAFFIVPPVSLPMAIISLIRYWIIQQSIKNTAFASRNWMTAAANDRPRQTASFAELICQQLICRLVIIDKIIRWHKYS